MIRMVAVSCAGLALAGCATENAVDYQTNTDTWAQAPNNQVDILWVIDNSFSMEEEQQVLAEGFAAFASQLESSGTDFQIGVITTSFDYSDSERGVLVGDPPFLTPDDDYEALFAARTSVGTGGSDKEKGLEAAVFALSPLMTVSGAPNEGFVRKDAQLLVIFVSDEEDCSDNGALEGQPAADCYTQLDKLTPVPTIVQDLQDLKDDFSHVQTGAIVGTRQSSCPDVIEGSRYQQVSALTGGLIGDICRTEWNGMLGDLGLNATGIRTSFQLSSAAQPDTLQVFVDDVEVPNDPQRGYTYDEASWFITFHKDAIPPRGSSVSASYTVDPGRLEPEVTE